VLAAVLLSAAAGVSASDQLLSVIPEGAAIESRQASEGEEALPSFAWNADLTKVAYAARRDKQALFVRSRSVREADEVRFIGFTPDQRSVLSICREKGGDVLRSDDRVLARSDEIRPPVLAAGRLAFASRRGDSWTIEVDGRRGPTSSAVGSPVFSPGGRRLAYWRRDGAQAVLWLDGAEAARMSVPGSGGLIGVDDPSFSPDGRRLAYQYRRPDGTFVVVVDGKDGPAFGDVGRLVFSPDSRRWMHSAGASAGQDHPTIVVDGQAIDGLSSGATFYRFARVWPYRFDADGRPMWVAGLEDGKEALAREGRLLGPFDGVVLPLRGPGGREAYVVRTSTRYYVEEGTNRFGDFASVSDLEFEPSGALSFTAAKDGRQFVVTDGRAEPPHDEVGPPRFAGGSLGYWARDGEVWRVIVDGKATSTRAPKAGLLLLTSHAVPVVTYRASDGWHVGVGAASYGPFDELGPTRLDEGNRRVEVGVRLGRELWRKEFPLEN
jgi:hypothetical protein